MFILFIARRIFRICPRDLFDVLVTHGDLHLLKRDTHGIAGGTTVGARGLPSGDGPCRVHAQLYECVYSAHYPYVPENEALGAWPLSGFLALTFEHLHQPISERVGHRLTIPKIPGGSEFHGIPQVRSAIGSREPPTTERVISSIFQVAKEKPLVRG